MSRTIQIGTILIEQGTRMPDSINVGIELYDLGWSAITNRTRSELGRELEGAGWTFFYMANKVKATGFGFDEQSRIHHAMAQLIKGFQRETFNCLEVTGMAKKSFWGVLALRLALTADTFSLVPLSTVHRGHRNETAAGGLLPQIVWFAHGQKSI